MANPQKHSGSSLRVPDRRFHLRRGLESPAHIELGGDNGGIVFNFSQGGLGVQSSTVLVEKHLPGIRFQLPRSGTWVKLSGKITWIGESQKEAGIQFIDLPEGARVEIEEWVSAGPSIAEFPEEIASVGKHVPNHVSLILALAIVSLGLMWIAFSKYAVPPLIKSAYRGESLPICNRMISGQASHPLAEYLSDWDSLRLRVLFDFSLVGLLVVLVIRLEIANSGPDVLLWLSLASSSLLLWLLHSWAVRSFLNEFLHLVHKSV